MFYKNKGRNSSNASLERIQLSKCICLGVFFMKNIVTHGLPSNGKKSIEERAVKLAQYIIDTKDTVRGAAKKFGISKSTVHMDVTQKNGSKENRILPESIEIRKVFLAERNPVVRFGLVIR